MRALLKAAGEAGWFAPPQLLTTPPGCPFFIAVAKVNSRNGGLPPRNLLGSRLATGCGNSREVAELVAMAEAAERYSIQFDLGLPPLFVPIRWRGGAGEPLATPALTLGAPASPGLVTSIGAAAGADLEDAIRRAALEQLEHFHLPGGLGQLRAIDPSAVAAIRPHAVWLARQLRRLDCRLGRFAEGYSVAACACTDLDGGRRTEGAAADLDPSAALTRAAQEAILFWRNMVEVERRGPELSAMSPEERAIIARYRGAQAEPGWPAAAGDEAAPGSDSRLPDADALLDCLARKTGRRVRVFDLSVPPIGISVVRVRLD